MLVLSLLCNFFLQSLATPQKLLHSSLLLVVEHSILGMNLRGGVSSSMISPKIGVLIHRQMNNFFPS